MLRSRVQAAKDARGGSRLGRTGHRRRPPIAFTHAPRVALASKPYRIGLLLLPKRSALLGPAESAPLATNQKRSWVMGAHVPGTALQMGCFAMIVQRDTVLPVFRRPGRQRSGRAEASWCSTPAHGR